MTTEEKLQKFVDAAMIHATNQAESILEGYKKTAENLYAEYKEQKEFEYETQIKIEENRLKRENNRAISEKQLQIRKELTTKQEELKEKLFDEVKEFLENYKKTQAYEELLIMQINEALKFSQGQDSIIYIDSVDADKKAPLEARTGATLTVSEYSFLGGTRAVISSRNMLLDHSFETRLKEEKANFTFHGGH